MRFENRSTAPYSEPCIVVANHESDCDVYVSSWLATLGWNMKYLSKKSLFDLPVFGPAMRLVGDISVIRGDRRSRLEAFERCRWWLAKGMPVLFFPEGTRSRSVEMASFKDGAFRLAIEAGAPIRPVIFAGTRGYLDTLPVNAVGKFEQALLGALREEKSILSSVETERALSGETEKKLVAFLDKFAKGFVV